MENKIPRVGVGVMIRSGNKFLLGKRVGSHGEGSWAPPGGKLDFGESIEDCAKREVLEETGVTIKNIRKITFTNDIFEEGKHYITCCVIAEIEAGEPRVMEAEKCEKWDWFEWGKFPEPLFLSTQHLLDEDIDLLKS